MAYANENDAKGAGIGGKDGRFVRGTQSISRKSSVSRERPRGGDDGSCIVVAVDAVRADLVEMAASRQEWMGSDRLFPESG
jgi:hypothetical protein